MTLIRSKVRAFLWRHYQQVVIEFYVRGFGNGHVFLCPGIMKGWGVRVRRVAAEVCWLAGWGFDFSSCESLVKCWSIWKAKQQSSQEPLPAACNFHSTPLKRSFLKLGYFQDDPSLPKKIAKDNPRVSEDFQNWPKGSRIRPKTTRRLLPMIIEDYRLLRITDRNLKLVAIKNNPIVKRPLNE